MHVDTLAVQALRHIDHEHGAVVPPIHLSSTFSFDPETGCRQFDYQRGGNPTRAHVENVLAQLEGARYGFAFASGMAADDALFSILEPGDEVLVPASVYGGTYRFVTQLLPRRGQKGVFVPDLGDLSDEHFSERTRMVFLETPANPTLRVTDIRAVAELAHRHGALVVVDNTFLTPVLQRPLELGADVVLQSATKYLGGHSDLLAGVITTNDEALAEQFHLAQKALGGILPPTESFRLLQGLKTLPLRLERQQDNAVKIVEHLRHHPGIAAVHYPGSASEQEARIQAEQARGGGAVLSFELADGLDAVRFLQALALPIYAVSLGGVESLICHPARMTHDAMSPEDLEAAGISQSLLRYAVGIEKVEDLIADLDQALAAAAG